jgi:hypothetical protein
VLAWTLLVAAIGAGAAGYWARGWLQGLSDKNIGALVIGRVAAQTGLRLEPAAISTRFSYHLIVEFKHSRLMRGGQELCEFDNISLVIGYRTLMLHNGLPLLAVIFEQPKIPWPGAHTELIPFLDAHGVAVTRQAMRVLAGLTRRIVIHGAEVVMPDGAPIVDHVMVDATRRYPTAAPWQVSAGWHFPGGRLPEFSAGAQMMMSTQDGDLPLARGSIWWAGSGMSNLIVGGADIRGQLRADATMTIAHDGALSGSARLRIPRLVVYDPRLRQPVRFADLSSGARFTATPALVTMSSFDLKAGTGTQLVAGTARIAQPLSPDPDFAVNLSAAPLDVSTLKAVVADINGLPAWVARSAGLAAAGSLTIDQMAFASSWSNLQSTPLLDWLKELRVAASLQGLSVRVPSAAAVLDNRLDAAIDYAEGILRFTQAQARLGQSVLTSIALHANLEHGLARVPYSLALAGDLDCGELFTLAHRLLPSNLLSKAAAIESLAGRAHASLEARGEITDLAPVLPAEYEIALRPYAITATLSHLPGRYEVVGGTLRIRPAAIEIDRMDVVPPRGRLTLSSALAIDSAGHVVLREAALELHRVRAEEWLPYIIDPHDVAVAGPAGGRLLIRRDASGRYATDGSVNFGPGRVNFNFLRSPVIIVNSASATFANGGLSVAMPGARFEGSPLDLDLKVSDFNHPEIGIDAVVQRLDVEAIKALRMPWSPPTPESHDRTRYRGSVIAREANLGALRMKDLQADFVRGEERWSVAPFSAQTLGGRIELSVRGQRVGDRVAIGLDLSNVDIAQLQALGSGDTVISGRLNAHASLEADTDNDFYQTLHGSVTIDAHDGVLNRMKLLSQMLSLVDISQWLNAQIPDPRVKGLPFKLISASFDGEDGNFHTDDFQLDGPVMKINALGNISLPSQALDAQVCMRPFQLLDTVFTKIPLIGPRLAESQSRIVAAYFNVYGPLTNPVVRPAPITSISKILIHTLGIPINLIRPDTIQ